ncbi:DUF4372 domain-containing protein [Halobacillus sp. MO56]
MSHPKHKETTMDKHTINTVFTEYIHPINEKVIEAMVDYMQLDNFTKKLYSLPFLKLTIYAQLTRFDSLKRLVLKSNVTSAFNGSWD